MRRKDGGLVPLEVSILARALADKQRAIQSSMDFRSRGKLGNGAKSLLSHGGLYKALGRMEEARLLARRWEDPRDR